VVDKCNNDRTGHHNYMCEPKNVFHRLMIHDGSLNDPSIISDVYMKSGEKGAIIMALNTQVNLMLKLPLAMSIVVNATNDSKINLLFKHEIIEVIEGNSTIYVSCGKMFENILNVACFLLEKKSIFTDVSV
jgi:hypothetical protein